MSAVPDINDLPEDDAHEATRRVFPRINWHDLWADDTEDEWLHEPLLPARRSVVIYSPAKAGKSLFILEMAVALSLGRPFLGYRCPRRVRVLYLDFENDPRGDVRTRLQAMGYGPDDLDHLDYLSFPTMAGLDTERGGLELLAAVHAYESEVVIIDTVCRAVDGEENSNDTWLGLYRNTGMILKSAGVAMIRLDHTGKDEGRGQRGGSAKSGDVDAVWKLAKVANDKIRLDCQDERMPIPVKSLHIQRQTSPRLCHVLEDTGLLSAHDQKVADLVKLCNDNRIPRDANRDATKAFIKSRGFGIGTDALSEIVRIRKASADLNGSGQRTTETAGDGETAQKSGEVSEPLDFNIEHEKPPNADLDPEKSGQVSESRTLTCPPQHEVWGTEVSNGQPGLRLVQDLAHPAPCHVCGRITTSRAPDQRWLCGRASCMEAAS